MDICRICLSEEPGFDIHQLRSGEKHGSITCVKMLRFCLDLEPKPDENITNNICTKCMEQLLNFFYFKSMALQNDKNLKTSIANPISNIKGDEISNKLDAATTYTVRNTIITKSPKKSKCPIENLKNQDDIKIILMNESDGDGNSDDFYSYIISYTEKEEKNNVTYEKAFNKIKKLKIGMCIDCSTGFYSKSDMKQHICPWVKSPARCKTCDMTFVNDANLKRHNNEKHGNIKQDKINKLNDTTEYTVGNTIITKLPKKSKFLIENLKNEDDIKIILMNESDGDGNSDDFYSYIMSYKKEEKNNMIYEKAFKKIQNIQIGMCIDCSTGFYSKSDLEQHICPWVKLPACCKICDMTFVNDANLKRHNNEKHGGISAYRFMCHFCSKGFYHKSNLEPHLRSHMNNRPFKCTNCNLAFVHKSNLKRHMETHRGEGKSYCCDICKKRFTFKRYLLRHMAVHDHSKRPRKVHPCSCCDRKFSSPYARNKHEFRKSRIAGTPSVCRAKTRIKQEIMEKSSQVKKYSRIKKIPTFTVIAETLGNSLTQSAGQFETCSSRVLAVPI